MKYLKTNFIQFSLLLLLLVSCKPYQNLEVSKTTTNQGGPQTLIYSLPKTRIDIDIEVTKTATKAGPYAAYAAKYLTLTNVPTFDSELFEISGVKIIPVNEPDPDNFYAVNFKSYPSNLDKLFTLTQQGLMLNLENSWSAVSKDFQTKQKGIEFERSIYEPNIAIEVDTLYKTILTDASFVKVPVYKKTLKINTEEEKAEDMANLILKLRKRRLKLMMGDYDYHPDGVALKVIIDELRKQEDEMMSHFIGKKIRQATHYTYSFIPTSPVSKELMWISEDKGVSETSKAGANSVSVSIMMKENVASGSNSKIADKTTNNIFFRSPVTTVVNVKLGNTVLSEARVPVYQAGKIQLLPIMP